MGNHRGRHQRGDARRRRQAGARARESALSAVGPSVRLGISIPLPGSSLATHGTWLRRIEDAGYSDVWTQETDGHDALTPLAFAAACTERVRLGSAIAGHMTRGPGLLAMQAAALAEAAPGRFVLGVGPSSAPIVEGWNGRPFEGPRTRTEEVVSFVRRALAGERFDFDGERLCVRGFRLERPPQKRPPIWVAALGPRMLALAGRVADGVLLSLAAPDDIPALRRALGEVGPSFEVGMRIGLVVDPDPEVARQHCRRLIAGYLTVDRYGALHRRLGRGEALEPIERAWRAGDRRAALASVPDAWVDELFIHGDVEACRRGIERFRRAGLDLPILSLMRWRGPLEGLIEDLASR